MIVPMRSSLAGLLILALVAPVMAQQPAEQAAPQAPAVTPAPASDEPAFDVLQFTPDEAFIDLRSNLADTWAATLGVLTELHYTVDSDLSYVASGGQISIGGLWLAVEPHVARTGSFTRVRIALGSGAEKEYLQSRAEVILDAIASRVETAAPRSKPASQPAAPYTTESTETTEAPYGVESQAQTAPAYYEPVPYYISYPVYEPYYVPYYAPASYAPVSSFSPWWGHCWNSWPWWQNNFWLGFSSCSGWGFSFSTCFSNFGFNSCFPNSCFFPNNCWWGNTCWNWKPCHPPACATGLWNDNGVLVSGSGLKHEFDFKPVAVNGDLLHGGKDFLRRPVSPTTHVTRRERRDLPAVTRPNIVVTHTESRPSHRDGPRRDGPATNGTVVVVRGGNETSRSGDHDAPRTGGTVVRLPGATYPTRTHHTPGGRVIVASDDGGTTTTPTSERSHSSRDRGHSSGSPSASSPLPSLPSGVPTFRPSHDGPSRGSDGPVLSSPSAPPAVIAAPSLPSSGRSSGRDSGRSSAPAPSMPTMPGMPTMSPSAPSAPPMSAPSMPRSSGGMHSSGSHSSGGRSSMPTASPSMGGGSMPTFSGSAGSTGSTGSMGSSGGGRSGGGGGGGGGHGGGGGGRGPR